MSPRFEALYEALGQYVENQDEYLDLVDGGTERERAVFAEAVSMLESMDAALAALAD